MMTNLDILRLESYSISLTENVDLQTNFPSFFVSASILALSEVTQINGAEYSSRPMPQLTHARLKESEASPFFACDTDS